MKARTASWIEFLALSYILTIVALLIEGLQLATTLLASLYATVLIT